MGSNPISFSDYCFTARKQQAWEYRRLRLTPGVTRPEEYDVWLDCKAGRGLLGELLRPFPASGMAAHAVSEKVNSPFNQGAGLIRPLDRYSDPTH
jgi:putative SOS response-associated peptidase YedK